MEDLQTPPEMAGFLFVIEPPAPMHRLRDRASQPGRTNWGEFMILQSLAGLPAFLVYFALIVQIIVYYLVRVPVPNLSKRIAGGELAAAGLFQGRPEGGNARLLVRAQAALLARRG